MMNFFKIFKVISDVKTQINKAMEDDYITLKEILLIANNALYDITGKDFDSIGIKVSKKNGKTKVEFQIK